MQHLPTTDPTIVGIAYHQNDTWYAFSRENHMVELLMMIALGTEAYYVLEKEDSSIH
jgi:hypothetical protein